MSQNAVRTEIALREKGLDFDRIELDPLTGEHKKPPFSELTPRQQAPTLVYPHDGEELVIYESIATDRFLDDMHPEPPLMPPVTNVRQRATALMRIEEFQAKLDPKNIFGSVAFRKLGREELAPRIEALRGELDRWEKYISGQTYLAGDNFTIADIAVFPLLMHFEALGFDYASKAPQLAGYIERCKNRASVRDTGWIDNFNTFVRAIDPEKVLA